MTKSAPSRPEGFKKPDYWTNEPAPSPAPVSKTEAPEGEDPEGISPTRYGDWVLKGIAVDF